MTHFLTRIEVNERRRGSRALLASPQLLHGAVMRCFPPSQAPARPLWRLDYSQHGCLLYIVSDSAPDATGFVEEYGWPVANSWKVCDYAPVLAAVEHGRQFAFRMTANPVHSVRLENAPLDKKGRRRTKRVAHVTVAQQTQWFLDRTHRWGFTVGAGDEASVRVVARRVLEFNRQERAMKIGTATFEGVLTIEDQAAMRRILVEGVGHAKAYGCGLLTIAPTASA